MSPFLVAAITSILLVSGTQAIADTPADRHAGYYYPEPDAREIYELRVPLLPDVDRALRVGFVTGLTRQMQENPFPSPFAIFAKGEEAEKLIIVATGPGLYDTLYRMRALLAMLTSSARLSPMFQNSPVPEHLTFFDLVGMLGFEQITVSDGAAWAHQIMLEP